MVTRDANLIARNSSAIIISQYDELAWFFNGIIQRPPKNLPIDKLFSN